MQREFQEGEKARAACETCKVICIPANSTGDVRRAHEARGQGDASSGDGL